MIRIGTNPIAWSNDDDRSLGAAISLEQCLREAAAIGFDGIEKGHKMPENGAGLQRVLAAHGLRLISGWHSLQLLERCVADEKRAIAPHLDLLQALGCEVCIVCETSHSVHGDAAMPLRRRPVVATEQWDRFVAGVDELAEYCQRWGLRLAYHHHLGTVVQTRTELEALMSRAGPVTGLLLDTGHAVLAGMDPAEVARSYGSRIAHVHLKNVRDAVMAQDRQHDRSFLAAVRAGVFTVPGDREGCVDFAPVLRAMAEVDYSGWLVVEAEQDPASHPPLRYQRLGYQTVMRLVDDVGFKRAGVA